MQSLEQIQQSVDVIITSIFNAHTIAIIACVVFIVYVLNRAIGFIANRALRVFIDITEGVDDADKKMRYRRAETSANIFIAMIRIGIIATGFFVLWKLLSPAAGSAAAIGASTLFIVLAGATIVPLLKDITSGSVMIAERWYGVGDYVTVEPFMNIQGVVEQVTLRSTKLRSLGGEVVWIHNQHIQAVKVKYRGTTTIVLDVFVKDKNKAMKLLRDVTTVIPKGPMMVINGLKVVEAEQLAPAMWRIELEGTTVPGREWLIERFAIEAINEADSLEGGEKIIVYGPIARYVDRSAEKRFKRAIKTK